MKTTTLLLLTAFIVLKVSAQNNAGIGTTTPHPSALLDLTSTSKGLLLPRVTAAQRAAIASPAKGLVVFDIDLNKMMYFNGSSWQNTSGGSSAGLQMPFDTTGEFPTYGIRITNTASVVSSATLKISNSAGVAISASTTSDQTARFNNTGTGTAVYATTSSTGIGVYGVSQSGAGVNGTSGSGPGVQGESMYNNGVYGLNTGAAGTGVYGNNPNAGKGVWGRSGNGVGVYGDVEPGKNGTAGKFVSPNGYALEVVGNLRISGSNTNPAQGRVLTSSDTYGNAHWEKPLASKVGFSVSGQVANGLDVIYGNAWAKMSFATEHYDPGNDYNLSNQSPASVFIVPVNGFYQLNALATLCECSNRLYSGNGIRFRIDRGGVVNTFAEKTIKTEDEDLHSPGASLSGTFRLLAGDKIWVELIGYSSYQYVYIHSWPEMNFFNGFLVHED